MFARPLVSVLYHYGAFSSHDVQQTSVALTGYGVGLLGLVAIKVLAPGFYANQDTRTPVRIAVAVLVFTQLMNWLLVPYLAHAALTLSIALGALVNALALLIGLRRQGQFKPLPGWPRLVLQVLLACGLMAAGLLWAAEQWDWTGLQSQAWQRIGLMVCVIVTSGVVYLVTLRVIGVDLRALLRR